MAAYLDPVDKAHVEAVYRIAHFNFVQNHHFTNKEALIAAFTEELVSVVCPILFEYLLPYKAKLGSNPAQSVMESMQLRAVHTLLKAYNLHLP